MWKSDDGVKIAGIMSFAVRIVYVMFSDRNRAHHVGQYPRIVTSP